MLRLLQIKDPLERIVLVCLLDTYIESSESNIDVKLPLVSIAMKFISYVLPMSTFRVNQQRFGIYIDDKIEADSFYQKFWRLIDIHELDEHIGNLRFKYLHEQISEKDLVKFVSRIRKEIIRRVFCANKISEFKDDLEVYYQEQILPFDSLCSKPYRLNLKLESVTNLISEETIFLQLRLDQVESSMIELKNEIISSLIRDIVWKYPRTIQPRVKDFLAEIFSLDHDLIIPPAPEDNIKIINSNGLSISTYDENEKLFEEVQHNATNLSVRAFSFDPLTLSGIIRGVSPENLRVINIVYSFFLSNNDAPPNFIQLNSLISQWLELNLSETIKERLRTVTWLLQNNRVRAYCILGFPYITKSTISHYLINNSADNSGILYVNSICSEDYSHVLEIISYHPSEISGSKHQIDDPLGIGDEFTSIDVTELLTEVMTKFYPPTSLSITNHNLLWKHQKSAVKWFIEEVDGIGILAMATGTGKTRTAVAIIEMMFNQGLIDRVIISASERLLHQWKRVITTYTDVFEQKFNHLSGQKNGVIFFKANVRGSILFVTYQLINELIPYFKNKKALSKTLIIVDEVHNIGSAMGRRNSMINMKKQSGSKDNLPEDEFTNLLMPIEKQSFYQNIRYRLGLSATPFSEYSQKRNQYIVDIFVSQPFKVKNNDDLLDELSYNNLIYYYSLKEAINDRILVPFRYHPLSYTPTDEELRERVEMFRKFSKLAEEGKVSPEAPYIMASSVLKRSIGKLDPFSQFIRENPHILNRCIIFCHTVKFAEMVAEIVTEFNSNYRIYVSGEDKRILNQFSKGEYDFLITCKMIAEGVDIQNIKNVVLFSSDRQKLETIQRIGRVLRVDPNNERKIANIVDFIFEEDKSNIEHIPADVLRKEWLSSLAMTGGW